jgi:SAM-dependent methyltransferase
MKETETHQSITELIANLSEMVRLRILRLLEAHELAVGEVAKVLQLPQSTVSRHLRLLTEGGWLVRRTEGTATLYELILDDLSLEARALWVTVRDQMASSADLDDDDRRLRAVLAERRLDSETFFGQVAGQWDDLRNSLFGEEFTTRALLSLLPRDWVVADLGCGTGNASEILSPYAQRVIAVDNSDAMLEAARKRLEGVTNVTFVTGTLEKLPLESSSVDAAVAVLVMHHIADIAPVLRELSRILRTPGGGGVALVVDMCAHDRTEYKRTMGHQHLGFAEDELRGLATHAGFAHVDWWELPSHPDGKGPGLFAAALRIAP